MTLWIFVNNNRFDNTPLTKLLELTCFQKVGSEGSVYQHAR